MKKCNRCNVEKPLTEYYKNSKRVYPYCKACAKQKYAKTHYESNKELYKQRAKSSQQKLIEEYREYKSKCSCQVCGETRHWCLSFHHTDPSQKDIEVATILTYNNRKRLFEEIEKCIVVCHNCHADIHYQERFAGVAQG